LRGVNLYKKEEDKLPEITYFCPECGWEGPDQICAVCGGKTESLDMDPVTGDMNEDDEDLPLEDIEDVDDSWEGEDDQY
jgi:hypothetical protein